MNLSDKRAYITSLDGVRGMAALIIVALHFSSYLFPYVGESIGLYTPMLKNSYLLVDLFFILSGFVLSFNYFEVFKREVSFASFYKFIYKRFLRLYPLHIATLIFLVVLHRYISPLFLNLPIDLFQVDRSNFSIMTNVFMMHSSGIGDNGCFDCTSWNYPSWSISVEWLSYFFLPIIIIFCSRFKRISFLVGGLLFVGLYFVQVKVGHLDVASTPGLYRAVTGMFIGVLLYRIGFKSFRSSKYGVFIATFLVGGSFHFIGNDTFLVGILAIFLLIIINGEDSNVFSSSWLQWLGVRSYSIYLIHVPVQDAISFGIRLLYGSVPQSLGNSIQIIGFIISMIITLAISNLTYLYFERYFFSLKAQNPQKVKLVVAGR